MYADAVSKSKFVLERSWMHQDEHAVFARELTSDQCDPHWTGVDLVGSVLTKCIEGCFTYIEKPKAYAVERQEVNVIQNLV